MSRRRRVRAALLLLLAVGCGVPTDAAPRPIPEERVPFDLLNPGSTPSTSKPPSPTL